MSIMKKNNQGYFVVTIVAKEWTRGGGEDDNSPMIREGLRTCHAFCLQQMFDIPTTRITQHLPSQVDSMVEEHPLWKDFVRWMEKKPEGAGYYPAADEAPDVQTALTRLNNAKDEWTPEDRASFMNEQLFMAGIPIRFLVQ